MFLKTTYLLNAAKVFLTGGMLVSLNADNAPVGTELPANTPGWEIYEPAPPGGLLQSDIPGAHERTLETLLKSYQREMNTLIPLVSKDPNTKKVRDFVQLFFMSDTATVVNHITPGNLKPDKALEPLAEKNTLRVGEFLKLAGGLYKKGFKYALDRDELTMDALDSIKAKDRLIHRYRITLPVLVQGRPSAQLQVEVQDTLDVYASVYSDGKQNIRYARIQTIVRKGTPVIAPVAPEPEPKPQPVPDVKTTLIDLPVQQKVHAFSQSLKTLEKDVSDEQFEKILEEMGQLFDPSGYVSLTTKSGDTLRLPQVGFYQRVRAAKSSYEVKNTTLVLFDQFRQNSQGKWFCRSTTYHDVSRFDKENPVPARVTSTPRMPMLAKAPTGRGSYWQLYEVYVSEK
jgi:hypothetical protein